MNVRRRNSVQKEIRDYIVPIVGVLLIIILIFSVFSGDDTTNIDTENKVGLELTLNGNDNESYIVYPGDFKKKIEGDISLYKGEKILIKEGTIDLLLSGLGDFKLNKLGELEYLENGDFSLNSSDLWINSESDINLDMKFAKVKISANSNISFSQNEVESTVYLVNGFAEVSNLAGESTILGNGQKITISRVDASKDDLDLSLIKENIDDYYKQSDWFVFNDGISFIKSESDSEETSSGSLDETGTGKTINLSSNNSQLINFTNLSDGANISSDSININGNFSNSEINKITVNGLDAVINTELKTFKLSNVDTSKKENDLVFKVYDDANDIISKFFYTVYFDGASTTSDDTSGSKFNVQTFDVDGSKFTFSSIKDGVVIPLNGKTTYTTSGEFLTLYGSLSNKGIDSVTVNGFKLSSFNGTTWRYHASEINNNLSIGTNVYEVKYFDASGKNVYTNHFTIIKKAAGTTEVKTEKIISDEVKVD